MLKTLPACAAVVALLLSVDQATATCDGNPHKWGRVRRCDEVDPACPDASWASGCKACEGIGGVAWGDDPDAFTPANCTVISVPQAGEAQPQPPVFPEQVRVPAATRFPGFCRRSGALGTLSPQAFGDTSPKQFTARRLTRYPLHPHHLLPPFRALHHSSSTRVSTRSRSSSSTTLSALPRSPPW